MQRLLGLGHHEVTDEQINRALGLVVIVLAMFTIAQAFYFGMADKDQRECIARNFVDLSEALDERSVLTERESAAAKAVNLIELDPTIDSDAEYIAELRAYEAEMNEIERLREKNPLPPYPAGECGEDPDDAAAYAAVWAAAITATEGAR